ncbi:hypothetical protein [Allomesorhizobium alhagi]|nr:hypothetical protein [Mesorhizobium alhagi]
MPVMAFRSEANPPSDPLSWQDFRSVAMAVVPQKVPTGFQGQRAMIWLTSLFSAQGKRHGPGSAANRADIDQHEASLAGFKAKRDSDNAQRSTWSIMTVEGGQPIRF